jgi:hypothetical protein
MPWDFSAGPAFEARLAWAREFVDEEVRPLEVIADEFDWRRLDEELRVARVGRLAAERLRRRQGKLHLPVTLATQLRREVDEVLGRSPLSGPQALCFDRRVWHGDLTAVDHEAAGLGDVGRPQGFLGRQVPRWLSELESYSRFDAYGERSVRDLETIPWYIALACFKLAIVLEGTHARACAGVADRASGDSLHGTAVALLERALDVIASRRQ